MSHDFNRDSQIVEARKKFGDWTGYAWLEILSIADRNSGIVPGTIEQIADRLAPISLKNYLKPASKVAQIFLEYARDCGWIGVELDHIQVLKYREYHPSREAKEAPPKQPKQPNETKHTKEEDKKPQAALALPDWINPETRTGFEEFWFSYPKKKNKGDAEKAWKVIRPNKELVDKMLYSLQAAKCSADWLKDNGQFIPYPASWLRAKGWEDEQTVKRGERPGAWGNKL